MADVFKPDLESEVTTLTALNYALSRELAEKNKEIDRLKATRFSDIYTLFPFGDIRVGRGVNSIILSTYAYLDEKNKDEDAVRWYTLMETALLKKKEYAWRMFHMLKDVPVKEISLLGSFMYIRLYPDDHVKRFSDLFAGTHYRKRKIRDFVDYYHRVYEDKIALTITDKGKENYRTGELGGTNERWKQLPRLGQDAKLEKYMDRYVTGYSTLETSDAVLELLLEV